MPISKKQLHQEAKLLFNIINKTHSQKGPEIIDENELKQARACGFFISVFGFKSAKTINEKEFIKGFLEEAERYSANEVLQEQFEAHCNNIKKCYEELEKYEKAPFALDSAYEKKELEVSNVTMERVPRNGMYSMYYGYKVVYKDGMYFCPEYADDENGFGKHKNILGLTSEIKFDIRTKQSNQLKERLEQAKSQEEKQAAMNDFLEGMRAWSRKFDPEFYRINGDSGRKETREAGYDIYFNVNPKDYSITFDYPRIYEQIR